MRILRYCCQNNIMFLRFQSKFIGKKWVRFVWNVTWFVTMSGQKDSGFEFFLQDLEEKDQILFTVGRIFQ